ncbi:MAG: hypothetical protein RLZZ282_1666 [Verrucomicrobiota bacterium]|jgi:PAS domain S-box-containing protein
MQNEVLQRQHDARPEADTARVCGQAATEHPQAETMAQIMRLIFEGSRAAKSVADPQGVIITVNAAFLQMWGYAHHDEVVGKPIGQLFQHPSESLGVFDAMGADDRWEGDVIGTRSDASTFVAYGLATTLRDALGIHLGYQLSVMDVTARKLAETALRTSEEKNRRFHDSIMDAFACVDMDGYVIESNQAYEEMLGYTAEELRRLTYVDLTPDRWHSLEQRVVDEQVLPLGGSDIYQKEYYRKDGSCIPVEMRTFLIRDAQGNPKSMWAIVRDISKRKQAEELARQSLVEKEMLLKEIHHRVKNNLQIITSLLRLQAHQIDHAVAKTALNDVQNRVQSIALIHDHLHRSNHQGQVNLSAYLTKLCQQLCQLLSPMPGAISLHLDMGHCLLTMDVAIPCGLLVNELVSNSFKHGFPQQATGEVRVELQWLSGGPEMRLRVSDNGVGLPHDFDLDDLTSLGLSMAPDLARQMGGCLKIGRGPGAMFEVVFGGDAANQQNENLTADERWFS